MDFDLDAKQNDDDDDIIELTEIIEKGNAAPATPSSTENDIFGAAVSDLGGGAVPDLPPDMDVDLDALLSQMDSDGGFSKAEEAERARAEAAAAAAAANAPSDGGDDFDIDAMLSAEFDGDGEGSGEAGSDDAPDEFSSGDFSSGDFSSGDLPDMADIDALLADMDMPEQPADEAPASQPLNEANSAEEMDALLESILDDKPAPAASQEISEEDAADGLEALFDSVLNDEPAPISPEPAPMPEPKPEPVTKVDVSTLNFGEEANVTSAPAAAPADDFDALFQEVLGDAPLSAADAAKVVVENVQKNAEEEVASASTSSPEDDAALLDMLFGQDGADAPEEMAAPVVSGAPTPTAGQMEAQEDVSSVLDMLDEFLPGEPPEAFAQEPAQAEVAEELDVTNLSDSTDTFDTTDSTDIFASEEEFVPPNLDEVAAMNAAAAAAAAAASMSAQSQNVQNQAAANPVAHDGEALQALDQRLGQMEEQMTQGLGDVLAQIQSLQESFAAQAKTLDAFETQIQAVVASQADVTEKFEQAEKAKQSDEANQVEQVEVAQQPSPINTQELERLRAEMASYAERVAKAEDLSQTVARDAAAREMAAREALSSYIDKLEFVAKEAVSRENTAQEHMQAAMAKLEQAVQEQEELSHVYVKRISDLEERLLQFEKTAEANMERMAVSAAAKILREEIAALMAGE